MRSWLKRSMLLLAIIFCMGALPANAWIINSTIVVTIDSIVTENVYIASGGRLVLSPGIALYISSGYDISVLSTGQLIVGNGCELRIWNGAFNTFGSSYSFFDSNSSLNFVYNSQCNFVGGTCYFNGTTINGINPTFQHNMNIYDGNTIQGIVNIHQWDDVNIYNSYWNISSTTDITFYDSCNFNDPTGSNTHIVNISGSLRFAHGTHFFNDDPTTRILRFFLAVGGRFSAEQAHMIAIPDFIGDQASSIAFTDTYGVFDSYQGIRSRGSIELLQSEFSAYDPTLGWNGILAYADFAALNMYEVRIRDINTTTNNYAIKMQGTQGFIHTIDHCTIYDPTAPYQSSCIVITGYNGNVVDCNIECTYIEDFEVAVDTYQGVLELHNSMLVYNTIGVYIHDNVHAMMEGNSIAENLSQGIRIENSPDNQLHGSEVRDNGTNQIYVDSFSDLNGADNNIYNSTPNTVLVVVNNFSNVDLQTCWWDLYPPVIGVDFIVDMTSNMNFPAWLNGPVGLGGWLYCGIILPKLADDDSYTEMPVRYEIPITNYPNPFNPSTQIEYTLPSDMNISLKIYSMNGKEVTTLFEGMQTEGAHTMTFVAAPDLTSGAYIYVLSTPEGVFKGAMMLLK